MSICRTKNRNAKMMIKRRSSAPTNHFRGLPCRFGRHLMPSPRSRSHRLAYRQAAEVDTQDHQSGIARRAPPRAARRERWRPPSKSSAASESVSPRSDRACRRFSRRLTPRADAIAAQDISPPTSSLLITIQARTSVAQKFLDDVKRINRFPQAHFQCLGILLLNLG